MRTAIYSVLGAASVLLSAVSFNAFADSMAGMDHMQGMQDMPGMSMSQESATLYTGTGVVKAWTAAHVAIAHQAIPALNWPPMTMQFLLQGYNGATFAPGQHITFTFKQVNNGYQLVSATAQ